MSSPRASRARAPRAAGPTAAAFLAAAGVAAACGGGDTGPTPIVPTRVTFTTQADSGIVGDTVALGARAVDASGRVAADAAFTYTSSDTAVVRVSAGGVVRYVAAGAAVVTARTPGGETGTLSLSTASLVSLAPAARVRPLPARVDAAPGTAVALSAVVYDSAGLPIKYPLSFTSDNAGVAAVAAGAIQTVAAGAAQVTVRADFRGRGVAGVAIPVTVAATPQGAFRINLVQIGTANPAYAQFFTRAAAFWQGVISAALPSATIDLPADACGDGGPALKATTTGVTINFALDSIDGPRGILGAAGPCVLRRDAASGRRGLTVLGSMVFDTADVGRLAADGRAYDVIRHEMAHVLGVGSLWNVNGVRATLVNAGTSDPVYVGAAGEAASAVLGFTRDGAPVPVENTGGQGSADSHWRTSVFGNELMTAFLGSGASHPASRLTVLSLADLGYEVNVAASEPLLPASPAAQRAALQSPADAFRDVVLPPLFSIEASGTGLRRLRATVPPVAAARRAAAARR